MKRISLLLPLCVCAWMPVAAQQEQQMQAPADSVKNIAYIDSIFKELPEVMITGERPIVKAEQGKLVYDLPRLLGNLPVDNAYDAVKNLPGVMDLGEGLMLGGQEVTVVINGKVTTLSTGQLNALLKSIPVSRIEKAEVMYSAPARYQVRGAMINLVLASGTGHEPSLQGELYTAFNQNHFESLAERGSLLYSGRKFSADLLYSYSYDRDRRETDKEALHTLADGSTHQMDMYENTISRNNSHQIRLGMDYAFTDQHLLSLVYTTAFTDSKHNATVTGAQNSLTNSHADNQLHNTKLDYQTPFGLKAGVEFTYYRSPGSQLLYSTLGNETMNFLSRDNQRINQWRFYAGQEHTLGKDWGLNYGMAYTTALDHSFQRYYEPGTETLLPDNNMQSRRREQTLNFYAGLSKSFGQKFSADISLAAEQYHTDIWNEWSFYPVANLTYTPAAGHMLQLSLSSDKEYPEYWSVQNATSYMGAYSEIQGNPLLKPAANYETTLSYILKGKYVFSAYCSYTKNNEMQTLYQSPDRLVEIYKFLNFDFSEQAGIMMVVPFKIKNWLDSRLTAVGLRYHQKDSDFWDISFDRKLYTFVLTMNNTFTLSTKPDLKLTLTGFYQNKMIQGTFDLPRSGNLNTALRYTFAKGKAQLTLKCDDIFNTSTISTRIRFGNQNVKNHYMRTTREFGISFNYKFGGYKEKKREEIDTSRFK
ncbi:outer membrane beta-barrel family protein [Bacteroides acidifaciens]|uniref:outer membrane beta-barrel family protein n=1 Tax=Bacteroides acidifaciens TaxID=85831 RepID=UPI00214A0FEB|nr:outer membrane beta-barrel protein [Bacteroides acidifaciens]MCR2006023.1 TonB-dependent receptor [Bacteroides acidifaciens]